jgi:hypothetical protein
VTLWLNIAVVGKLNMEASQRQISPNALAAQVVINYLEWYSNTAKAGFFTKLQKMKLKLFVLMLKNKYAITSSIAVMDYWMRVSGYSNKHEIEDTCRS